jgi:hypothetical protein
LKLTRLGKIGCALIAVTLSAWVMAAPKQNNRGKGHNKPHATGQTIQVMTCAPETAATPVSNNSPLHICIDGFSFGNFVTIGVPWVGDTSRHSMLSFSKYIDESGGFCIDSPPSWTQMALEPGTYTIKSAYYDNGSSDSRREGPTTTFEVF